MSCASFFGSGHRIELYGEHGTLVLHNPSGDYFRGFELRLARRGDDVLKRIPIENADKELCSDSRIGPVKRLVARFMDAYERGGCPSLGLSRAVPN